MTIAPRRRWAVALLLAASLATACRSSDRAKTEAPPDDSERSAAGAGVGASGSALSVRSSGLAFAEGPTGPASLPGVTATGRATATVPAERATVVVLAGGRGLVGLAQGFSAADRSAVTAAAAAAGIAPDSVRFEGDGPPGRSRVEASMPVADVPTRGPQFVAAVEKAVGRSDASGVVYGLADCGQALADLRRQAFADANGKAQQVADTASVRLGPLVAVTSTVGVSRTPLSSDDPCDPNLEARGIGYGAPLSPLDAPAEVPVSVSVTGTWALPGAPPPANGPRSEVAAVGRGSATATADEAYVVVVFSDEDEDNPRPLTQAQRTQLLRAVTDLGVPKDDVEIVSANRSGTVTVVQVKTKVSDVEKRGDEVVRATEKVLGRAATSGVRYGRADCREVTGRARKEAVADARARATALADASGVRLGNLQSVADASLLAADPCDDTARSLLDRDDEYTDLLQPFDAPPRFAVELAVRVGFGIAG